MPEVRTSQGSRFAIVLALATIAVVRYRTRDTSARAAAAAEPSAGAMPAKQIKPAAGQRITVEVLNATRVRGLARRAAITLRDHGFDVVSTGTNPDHFDSTTVLARTGHPEWAALAVVWHFLHTL